MTRLLDINEAADFLHLAPITLYKYSSSRKIPFLRIGRRIFFDISELESWLQGKKIKPIQTEDN